ncbi:glycosyltransferase family 4 protein [Pseudanabaena mucicola]|uniref:Glycosyltransferase family 4 protein n=1 Tax=Pseudanabaena mucicola FACHB-723 TaxID=2692860 RepID=A0ABR8A0D5_9CYAN|nr:glycosyltransferase family 4 protein [Pseudanabaena mucicola]MBD2189001.1 glycosyltransferase family 4 protein [Pseudanabaena mucicola FACHB-723]
MKVLIIPEFSTQQSGTFRFFKTLIKTHINDGIETTVILEKYQLSFAPVQQLEDQNIKIFEVSNRSKLFKLPYLSLAFDIFTVWNCFSTFKPDIIHVSNGTPGLMLGVLLFPCSVVFTMHTYPISKLFISKLSILLVGIYHLISHFAKQNKSFNKQFVTVSQSSAVIISKYFKIPRQLIDVIPNGVPYSDNYSNLTSQTILTVGHVMWYKNPDIWLKIAQKSIQRKPSLKFIWLGTGDLLDKMKEEVDNLGLCHQILFKGSCEDVNSYYVEACIYLQPSLVESQGIAVLEAMSYGLPCVVSDVGGLSESVIDGKTGFICSSQNVDEFVSKLFTLLENTTLMKHMGDAGKQRVTEYFSELNQSQSFLALYHKILEKS